MDKAVAILERALPPLGIEPVLMITEIDTSTTRSNPAEGNRITIAGRTIDEWLGGSAGTARCSVCGAVDCLAPVVGGFQVEAIPARLLLRAALLASAALLDADPAHD